MTTGHAAIARRPLVAPMVRTVSHWNEGVPRDGIFTEIIDFFRNYRFFGRNITVTMG
jgi:hypothetical protein